MSWPQYLWIALALVGLGYESAKHGQPRDAHNFWSSLGATAIIALILYLGGFFG